MADDPDVKRWSVAGVELVTIPLSDYAELIECRQTLARLRTTPKAFYKPSRSPIERNQEVAAFLAERFGKMNMWQILSDCCDRFGVAATPSHTAAYGYWKRLRDQARMRGL